MPDSLIHLAEKADPYTMIPILLNQQLQLFSLLLGTGIHMVLAASKQILTLD